MSDKKFDKILQQKLKGHQVKLGGPNWADMEKILNESEQSQNLDREVRNRLQNHTVEYKESHWQILKNKLELEKNLKEKIYLSKIAEFSILALLLFSAFHFNQQNAFDSFKKSAVKQFVSKDATAIDKNVNPVKSRANIAAQPQTNIIPETSSIHNTEVVSDSNPKQEKSNQSTTIFNTADSKALEINTKNEESIDVNSKHSTFGPIRPLQSSRTTDDVKTSDIGKTLKTNTSQESPLQNSSVFTDQNRGAHTEMLSPILLGKNKLNQSSNSSSYPGVTTVNLVSGKSLNMFSQAPKLMLDRKTENDNTIANSILLNSMDIAYALPMAKLDYSSLPQKNERWIGAMTGVDINLIRRPIDPDKIDRPQNFAVVSLTTGANYSTKKGRNEFFTGIGYSEKFYDPLLSELIKISDSFYDREYTLEKYDIIHVPAHYKRHLGDSNKLHAYAFGGVSMNFVIYTDYEQQDNLRRGQPRSKQVIDTSASYDDTGDKGLLEGGYYKDNIYFTADLGLGLEKQFNRFKIFFESQYKRNLFSSQLGPRKVKLSSLSFNIGTKYRI